MQAVTIVTFKSKEKKEKVFFIKITPIPGQFIRFFILDYDP